VFDAICVRCLQNGSNSDTASTGVYEDGLVIPRQRQACIRNRTHHGREAWPASFIKALPEVIPPQYVQHLSEKGYCERLDITTPRMHHHPPVLLMRRNRVILDDAVEAVDPERGFALLGAERRLKEPVFELAADDRRQFGQVCVNSSLKIGQDEEEISAVGCCTRRGCGGTILGYRQFSRRGPDADNHGDEVYSQTHVSKALSKHLAGHRLRDASASRMQAP
jgi:hypothetical protein